MHDRSNDRGPAAEFWGSSQESGSADRPGAVVEPLEERRMMSGSLFLNSQPIAESYAAVETQPTTPIGLASFWQKAG